MGARGERSRRSEGWQRGAKGSKAYRILGLRVPTISVGARGERLRRSEGGKGEQSILYTRF